MDAITNGNIVEVQEEKLERFLTTLYSLHEADAITRYLTDPNAPLEEIDTLLTAIDKEDDEFITNY